MTMATEDQPQNTFGRRDLGMLLSDTFTIFGRNILMFLAITATVYAPLYGLSFGLMAVFGLTAASACVSDPYDIAAAMAILIASLSFAGVMFVVYIIITPLVNGALVGGTVLDFMQGKIDYGKAFGLALKRFGTLILVTLLMGLALLLRTITVIGIPVEIWLGVRWAFVYQAVIIEGHDVEDAFSRSSSLVKGNWWRVFGLLLLWVVVIIALSAIASIPLAVVPVLSEIVQFAIELFTVPLLVIYATLIFFDLRAKHEEFTPEMLAEDMDMVAEYQDYRAATPPEAGI